MAFLTTYDAAQNLLVALLRTRANRDKFEQSQLARKFIKHEIGLDECQMLAQISARCQQEMAMN